MDLGDVVQGTPMADLATGGPHPHAMVRSLAGLGCDGLVIGNHEFNFGHAWWSEFVRTCPFPVLAANVFDDSGECVFQPVLRVRVNDRTIAILTLTTPQVPRWEVPSHIAGLDFRDAVATAKAWVPRLRAGADAIVVAAHMGWDGVTDGSRVAPSPPENDVARLVAEVPGIDAVVMAHTHDVVQRVDRGVVVVQPGARGEAIATLTLAWSGGERAPRITGRVHRVDGSTPADAATLAEVESDERAAATWLDRTVAVATAPFSLEGARYRDNAVLSLLHRASLDATGADLSSSALFRPDAELRAGPVRVRDLYRIYPFVNGLAVVEFAVDDVRVYLEEIASAYLGPATGDGPPPLDPAVRIYNHDALAGAEYVIDPGRPVGERVVRLTFGGGELAGTSRLTMAVSSYRAQGGGGYSVFGRARRVVHKGREMRALLIDWASERSTLEPFVFDNWRVVGS